MERRFDSYSGKIAVISGNIGVFGRRQPGLCLYESLPGRSEILILAERDPDCVSSRWDVERFRSCSGVEINRSIHREPKKCPSAS